MANKVALVKDILGMIFQMLLEFECFKQKPEVKQSRQEHVFEQFHDAIIKYHRESREVTSNADKLSLSPKYMSNITKQTTGRTASEWINEHIIRESKNLLKTRKELPILEVCDMMGFSDQATFSRYFKKMVGVNPSEYRTK